MLPGFYVSRTLITQCFFVQGLLLPRLHVPRSLLSQDSLFLDVYIPRTLIPSGLKLQYSVFFLFVFVFYSWLFISMGLT